MEEQTPSSQLGTRRGKPLDLNALFDGRAGNGSFPMYARVIARLDEVQGEMMTCVSMLSSILIHRDS